MASSLRYWVLLIGMVLGVHGRDLWTATHSRRALPAGSARAGQNVILVVADGLRWQEVFRGADSTILFGDPALAGGDVAAARSKYWRGSVAERRAALMPFLSTIVARNGQLFGNRDVGSASLVTNPMKFSYPGYNELLVGFPDPRIDRNDFGPNPNRTVFEWLERQDGFSHRVAAVGMWSTFVDIFNAGRSGIPVRDFGTDAETYRAAVKLMSRERPAALFVGFGATDDFAHKRRYDLTLDAAHEIDRHLAQLWAAAQASPAYRGRTTIVVVADHGRGRTPQDWTDHNYKVPGAEETWMAIIGPGIPSLGERANASITLAQTAATVARAAGMDYRASVPRAAPPVGVAPSAGAKVATSVKRPE